MKNSLLGRNPRMAHKFGSMLFLALLGLMGGCTPDVAVRTPAETPKQNKVQRVVHDHFVNISAHNPKLSRTEKKNLHGFLTQNVFNPYAVTVYVEEYGGHSEERIKMVTSILKDYGVQRDHIVVDEYDPQESAHIRQGSGLHLIVEGFVVIPPNCLNWSESLGEAKGANTVSNFGCADAVNFGMMVSDPRDLIAGRETGGYDGTRHALDVQMYREDRIKALKVEQSGVGATASSSSSGGATP